MSVPEDSSMVKPKKIWTANEMGRVGGLKGGPARAKKLSARRRREISMKAANARWAKHRKAKKEAGDVEM